MSAPEVQPAGREEPNVWDIDTALDAAYGGRSDFPWPTVHWLLEQAREVEGLRTQLRAAEERLGGMTEEFKDAEDGGGSSWSTGLGRQGGSTTLPTRYRRFVTAWEVIRPRQTREWST